ncbi:Serine--glyoxylate aminotransferase [Roseovarius sp. EC-HK134]|uniref:pyridoxal-phosphate-dependent aminotransferase family protein n=1 Tax=Roseovarius TaxID=74030 RepID=UPI0001556877|nr:MULTISPECIES: aminotransferase class V-fold PLP-dependent enzyme [Roseovarius]AWZ21049.1 Serine--glyoxylate aminotransferase [Roseovarius sp. AK1035]EDM32927.1 probable serine-glyoxylate aminotransferase [Roseovarius sp. TM1035]MBW4975895.1 aminotransferase class V-fold PLP-dependent enzyme [Roseovarius mucosus]VVT23399.1 Serine--glyoxylate aminotransferase [Roseovarius sp. EC-SD190]VVT23579.1 Serine--glyoxylate aminotransferase [Roseovarius sp. EC-HK134]
MNGHSHLFIPGPTNVPEEVRRAMNIPMEDMRAPDFGDFILPLLSDLKKVFRLTHGRVFVYPTSGTGAWEAAISNTLNTGDRVLMSRFGQFSMLWVDMAERLGLDVDLCEVDWGKGVPVEDYAAKLTADKEHKIKAVFATHNETATGVTSNIAAIRAAMDAANHPALLFVDGVSSIGSIEFEMEDWGVDLAVAGSQKGFMLPAGLGLLGVSDKALAAHEHAKMPRCYFSFADMIKLNDTGYFPYTPATQLLRGLRCSLDMLLAAGMESVWDRHHRLASGVRAAIAEWQGCRLVAHGPEWHSDTVSAIYAPEGVDARDVIATAYHKYQTSLGSGLAKLAGRAFRIGHLGSLNPVMLCGAISAAEMALRDAGAVIEPGCGIAAAQEHFRASTPTMQVRVAPARAA